MSEWGSCHCWGSRIWDATPWSHRAAWNGASLARLHTFGAAGGVSAAHEV